MQRVLVVPDNNLRFRDAKKAMQTRMVLLEPGNLTVLVGFLALLGVPVALLGLLGLLILLTTVAQLATVVLLKLEVHVGRAYAPDSGCRGDA